MLGDHDSEALVGESSHDGDQVPCPGGIKLCQRFIEKDESSAGGQRTPDHESLLLTP